MKKLISSEFVSKGHPDKIADFIADSILDECLRQDKNSHSAVEVMIVNGTVFIGGELTTNAYVDINNIAREAIKKAGYDNPKWGFYYKTCGIITSINEQSNDINSGVVNSEDTGETGAWDQGIMFGYATREFNNENFLPYPYALAHKLIKKVENLRETSEDMYNLLGPDYKAEVTVEFDTETGKQKPVTALISCMHEKGKLKETKKVLKNIVKDTLGNNINIIINPAGKFETGGPVADTGLTGRKIIVDTYGGAAHHGGGAFSGKDATKVDRSAAYLTRNIAKTVLEAKENINRCEVQIGYAIGKSNPVSLNLSTVPEISSSDYDKLIKGINKAFDLTPSGIIKEFNLNSSIFNKTTNGAFFNTNFSWEKIDPIKVKIIKEEL